MYEISLVPELKDEFLKKQRMRNMIILVCVGVAAASAAIVVLLLLVLSGQNIAIGAQSREISCRYNERDENGRTVQCDSRNTGTPIAQFSNMETLLTIQDQMESLNTLNSAKIKFSRIFGLLDVLLLDEPNGQVIEISELSANFSSMTLSFNAVGYDRSSTNIGYKALETFKKNTDMMYYDYGDYMRIDENGNEVVIPYYCITETELSGRIYGIYHKGEPGCEAPMVSSSDDESAEEDSTENEVEKVDIYIRRSYESEEDKISVKSGEDKYGGENAKYKGYSFNSSCMVYTDTGFDENATISRCKFLSQEMTIGSSSYGRNSNGEMVLSFSVSVPVASPIFMAANHNMRIVGPSRQNATDSYVQIRDMFTESASEEIN